MIEIGGFEIFIGMSSFALIMGTMIIVLYKSSRRNKKDNKKKTPLSSFL